MVAIALARRSSQLVRPFTSSPKTSAASPETVVSRCAAVRGSIAPGMRRPVVMTTSTQSSTASSSVLTTRIPSRTWSAPAANFAACARSKPSGSTTHNEPAPVFARARAAAPMFCELRGRCRTNRITGPPSPGRGCTDSFCHGRAALACGAQVATLRRLMDRMDLLHAQLPHTLREANFPQLGSLYRGKVRDNFSAGDRIVMVTTDRLSAFDRVLTTVPFKGEVLNRLTVFWFDKTKDIVPNHILDVPDPSVLVVRKLQPLPLEMVVRGYLTGSLWRDYQAGRGAKAYGIELPPSLRKDEKFPTPILTPSTKEEAGKHDE